MAHLPTAVIFDMDGVIADTERLSLEAFTRSYADAGIDLAAGEREGLLGLSIARVDAFVRERHPGAPGLEWLKATYRPRYLARLREGLEPLPGVLELLAALADAAVPVAVASSSPRDQIELVLAETGAARHLETIAAGDEVEATKPAPDVYLLALARLGVGAPGSVAVEDSPAGVAAAVAAGLACLGVGEAELPGATAAVPTLEGITPERLGNLTGSVPAPRTP